MYTLSPTFWSWWHGLRGFTTAYVDSVGKSVGFFGQKGGELILPMHSIERVLIGFVPARSHRIYYTYLWYSGGKHPITVRGVGSPPYYSSFVLHLVAELEQLRPAPHIECGATFLHRIGTIFALYGLWILLTILLALSELQDDMYSILDIGPEGSAVFAAVAVVLGFAGWRHDRRWYRPRPCSRSQLSAFLPNTPETTATR